MNDWQADALEAVAIVLFWAAMCLAALAIAEWT